MLTSLPRVKDYASIENNESDGLLNTLLDAVSKRIQTYLRRTITQTRVTAEKHARGQCVRRPPRSHRDPEQRAQGADVTDLILLGSDRR